MANVHPHFSRICIVLVGIQVALIASATVTAAVYDQYTPSRHNRFATENAINPLDPAGPRIYSPSLDPGFIMSSYDLSGIGVGTPRPGMTADHSTGRAVLITPQHYISAAHASTAVPKFVGSDGVAREYSASMNAPTRLTTFLGDGTSPLSDIVLYKLNAPIPMADGVNPIAILDGDTNNLIGRSFFLMSDPLEQADATGTGVLTHRVGKNVVRDVVAVQFGGSNPSPSFAIDYTFDPTDPSKAGTFGGVISDTLGIDETGLIGGDSGNIAVVDVGGQLAVIGAHYGISSPADASAGNFYRNYSTLLTPYLNEIEAITMADGLSINRLSFSVSAVPEPNCFFCLSIALLGIVHRRRR